MTRSDEFKEEAVHGLRCINTYGYYYREDGESIESVRKLITGLGISSSTLYRWDDNTSSIMILEPDRNKKVIKFVCGGCGEEFESYHDGIGYNTGFCPPCLVKHETVGLEPEPEPEPEILEGWKVAEPETKDMYIKIDNTFLMAFARGLGISNYRAPQSQLYLKVGLELIKKSGLVKSEVIEELKL